MNLILSGADERARGCGNLQGPPGNIFTPIERPPYAKQG